jgi:hypothetical protein
MRLPLNLKDRDGEFLFTSDILEYRGTYYVIKHGNYKKDSNGDTFYLKGLKKGVWKNIKEDIYADIQQEKGFAFLYLRTSDYFANRFYEYLEKWGLKKINPKCPNYALLQMPAEAMKDIKNIEEDK